MINNLNFIETLIRYQHLPATHGVISHAKVLTRQEVRHSAVDTRIGLFASTAEISYRCLLEYDTMI